MSKNKKNMTFIKSESILKNKVHEKIGRFEKMKFYIYNTILLVMRTKACFLSHLRQQLFLEASLVAVSVNNRLAFVRIANK